MSVWNLVEFSSTTNLPLLYYVAILYAFGINIFRVEPADAIFSLWDGTPRTPLLRRKTFLIWKTAPSMTHKSSFNKFFFKLVESFFSYFKSLIQILCSHYYPLRPIVEIWSLHKLSNPFKVQRAKWTFTHGPKVPHPPQLRILWLVSCAKIPLIENQALLVFSWQNVLEKGNTIIPP